MMLQKILEKEKENKQKEADKKKNGKDNSTTR